VPQKLSKAYLLRLKREQMRQAVSQLTDDNDQMVRRGGDALAGEGMLKSFEGHCAGCGQQVVFRVDTFGYCRCEKCGYQANNRIGVP
jgi:hypothetical protein